LRTYHKIAGAICALQIVVWILTGLLFNDKYRYDEVYEPLRATRAAAPTGGVWVSPAEALARAGVDPSSIARVHLLDDNRGPLYLIESGDDASPELRLANARTGELVSPLDAAGAEAALRSALASSPHAARYGEVASSEPTAAASALVGRETPAWALNLATGQTVTVNAYTAEISHKSALNRFIDLTYAVHYMQYTPWKTVNVAIVLVFSLLVLSLVASGLRLLIFGDRARQKQMFGGRRLSRRQRIRF
jgi:uncharacterized iron-regulated membrane protein